MLQQPKRLRYRRPSDGKVRQYSKRGNQLAFGSFGIKALDSKWITASHTSLSPASPPTCAWVKVKVTWQDMLLPSSQDAS